MAEAIRRAFVCGFPIAHSRSPLIHIHWLRTYGIAGSYDRREVAPGQFTAFIEDVRREGFAGGNVTIPHKETAFSLLEQRDEAADIIGAANTLWFEDGKLCGSNTDAYGFAANLDAFAPGWTDATTATVLGAGGAARAIVHALLSRGFKDIRIVNRTLQRAQELCHRFRGGTSAHSWEAVPELLSDSGLLVNTTALGMDGGSSYHIDLDDMPDSAVVTDIVYVPLQTPILKTAARRGLRTVDGLGMLLHQAVPGFERWFGKRPEVTAELRQMIIADMEKPH